MRNHRSCVHAVLMTLACLAVPISSSALGQEKTPGFNQKIPEEIMSPDKVETRIGTLNLVYGPLEPWIDKTWRPGEFELVS